MKDITDEQIGLTQKQYEFNKAKFGTCKLIQSEDESLISEIFSHFKGFSLLGLLLMIFTSFLQSTYKDDPKDKALCFVDPFIGFMIILVNMVLTLYMRLKFKIVKNDAIKITIIREGNRIRDSLRCVTQGDIIELTRGDIAPANMHIIKTFDKFKFKNIKDGQIMKSHPGDMIPPGSCILKGSVLCMVADLSVPAKLNDQDVPTFHSYLERVSSLYSFSYVVICIIFFILEMRKGHEGSFVFASFRVFQFLISIIIAAVPEYLSSIFIDIEHMFRFNVWKEGRSYVKKDAVSALSKVNVICGNLESCFLKKDQSVTELITIEDGSVFLYQIDNSGKINSIDEKIQIKEHKSIAELGRVCSLMHKPSIQYENGRFVSVSEDFYVNSLQVLSAQIYSQLMDSPIETSFSNGRSFWETSNPVTNSYKDVNFNYIQLKDESSIVMGSIFDVCENCTHYASDNTGKFVQMGTNIKEKINYQALEWEKKCKIPIGFALRNKQSDLIWIGGIAIYLEIKDDSIEFIEENKENGIKTMVFSSLSTNLCQALGKKLRLIGSDQSKAIDSEVFLIADQKTQNSLITKCTVFSGFQPEHVVDIIKNVKQNGNHVAVMGFGIDDLEVIHDYELIISSFESPSCNKYYSSMIIPPEKLCPISEGILIAKNATQVSSSLFHYQISTGVSFLVAGLLIPLLGGPLIVSSSSVLIVSLLTQSFSVFLSFNKANSLSHLKAPNISTQTHIFSVIEGLLMGVLSVASSLFYYTMNPYGPKLSLQNVFDFQNANRSMKRSLECKSSMMIISLALFLCHIFSAWSLIPNKPSITIFGPKNNPHLFYSTIFSFGLFILISVLPIMQQTTGFVYIRIIEYGISILCAVPLLIYTKIIKFIRRNE